MKQVDIVIQRKREEAEEVHKSNARWIPTTAAAPHPRSDPKIECIPTNEI